MGSKKTIIISSIVICVLLLAILYMDYRIKSLEDNKDSGDGSAAGTDAVSGANLSASADSETSGSTPAKGDGTASGTKTEGTEDSGTSLSTDIGTLDIVSYPAGAAVFLDDKEAGTTPYQNFSVPIGNYSLKLVKAGYGDYCKTIYIYKSKVEKVTALFSTTEVGCDGATGSVQVPEDEDEEDTSDSGDTTDTVDAVAGETTFKTTPSSAEVKINGVLKGTTPLSTKLSEGTHMLKISKSGYQIYQAFITVGSDGYISGFDGEQNGEATQDSDDKYSVTLDEI